MIKTSVIGATGYAGAELVRLLASHPQVEIAHLVSHSYAGQDMNQIYKNFEGKFSKTLDPLDIDMLIEDSDCIFYQPAPFSGRRSYSPALQCRQNSHRFKRGLPL